MISYAVLILCLIIAGIVAAVGAAKFQNGSIAAASVRIFITAS